MLLYIPIVQSLEKCSLVNPQLLVSVEQLALLENLSLNNKEKIWYGYFLRKYTNVIRCAVSGLFT